MITCSGLYKYMLKLIEFNIFHVERNRGAEIFNGRQNSLAAFHIILVRMVCFSTNKLLIHYYLLNIHSVCGNIRLKQRRTWFSS